MHRIPSSPDIALGKQVDVEATPTAFVNGNILEGVRHESTLLDFIHKTEDRAGSSNSLSSGSAGGIATNEAGTTH